MRRLDLTLFAHVCARPEAELDLAEAALLIAAPEYPGLDLGRYARTLDELGRGARAAIAGSTSDHSKLSGAVTWLYGDAGFRGDEQDYYDPRNSFLNEVLERRRGIPITLAVVLIEVLGRAGVEARGVSFPGHFLVRSETTRGAYVVDPFAGKLLTRDELRALHKRVTGEDRDPPSKLLEPAPKKQILLRMLTNLRGIYERRADSERLLGVLERMAALAPSDELKAEIAKLGGTAPWRSTGHALN